MDLHKRVNDTVHANEKERKTISENIDRLTDVSKSDYGQIDEAVTTWLARLRNVAEKGNLDPSKRQNVAYVLGALMALSDPNIADAFDEKNDLGTLLYAVSGEDKAASQAAIQRLIQMGRHPSANTYVSQAEQILNNPQQIIQTASQLQGKIDQVMRTKLAKERGAQGSQQQTTSQPQQSPQQPAPSSVAPVSSTPSIPAK